MRRAVHVARPQLRMRRMIEQQRDRLRVPTITFNN